MRWSPPRVGARAMGWAGFNCSISHKVAVTARLDEVSESVAFIGSSIAASIAIVNRDRSAAQTLLRYSKHLPTL